MKRSLAAILEVLTSATCTCTMSVIVILLCLRGHLYLESVRMLRKLSTASERTGFRFLRAVTAFCYSYLLLTPTMHGGACFSPTALKSDPFLCQPINPSYTTVLQLGSGLLQSGKWEVRLMDRKLKNCMVGEMGSRRNRQSEK